MYQHDCEVDNGSGADVRSDLNLALKALADLMTGSKIGLTTFPNQLVADTDSGHLIKRNNANSDWDYIMPIDQRIITSAVGSDSYAITLSPTIATPTYGGYRNGVAYRFRADVANTGTASLNINSLGAKTIKKYYNGTLIDLSDNDIIINQIVEVIYDSTNNCMIFGGLSGSGFVISVQTFTTVGTNSYTPTSEKRWALVVCRAGGGGGGDTNGGGGGGGGLVIEVLDILTLSTPVSVTVGARGNSGSPTGGTGGTSSFGLYCSASGGIGGGAGGVGGAGGTGTGGDAQITGGDGESASIGHGGCSYGYLGGNIAHATDGNIYGGGGSGAGTGGGFYGAQGRVDVFEFPADLEYVAKLLVSLYHTSWG